MTVIHNIQRQLKPLAIVVFLLLFTLGAACRLFYVVKVGQDDTLNVFLLKTDMLFHDLMAKNLLHPHPLDIRLPIYPFFMHVLKIFYSLFGTEVLSFYLFQWVLSMASVILLTLTGTMIFGLYAGLFSGLFLLFYRMNFLYDGLLLNTALSQFLIIASLFFFCAYHKKNSLWLYAGFCLCGIGLSLMRVFFWFIILPAAIYLFIKKRQWEKPSCILLNLALCALAIVLFFRLHPSDTYSHKFGYHFYLGNHADGIGLLSDIEGVRSDAAGFAKDTILLARKETGNAHVDLNFFWIKKTIDSYRNRPWDTLKNLMNRINYLANNFEPHNTTSVYFYEKMTVLKHLPRINYTVIFVFSCIGLILTFIKKHQGRLLLIPVIFLTLMILSVFICARYRMPLVPFLCLYAGYGLYELGLALREKKIKLLVALLLIGALAAAWSLKKIIYFHKEVDIAYWEGRYQEQIWLKEQRNYALSKLPLWNDLSLARKVDILCRLERLGIFREFDARYDQTLLLVKDKPAFMAQLLLRRANMYNSTFQFREALNVWQQLKSYPFMKEEAEKEIEELNIVGPLLNHDFNQ